MEKIDRKSLELLEQIIGDDVPINIATTNREIGRELGQREGRSVEILEEEPDAKRYYQFIILDRPLELKPVFRALRNGGYLIFTNFAVEENLLNDIGFSAISRIDNFTIAKKVHSWNDW
jgi:hypothetical protein